MPDDSQGGGARPHGQVGRQDVFHCQNDGTQQHRRPGLLRLPRLSQKGQSQAERSVTGRKARHTHRQKGQARLQSERSQSHTQLAFHFIRQCHRTTQISLFQSLCYTLLSDCGIIQVLLNFMDHRTVIITSSAAKQSYIVLRLAPRTSIDSRKDYLPTSLL